MNYSKYFVISIAACLTLIACGKPYVYAPKDAKENAATIQCTAGAKGTGLFDVSSRVFGLDAYTITLSDIDQTSANCAEGDIVKLSPKKTKLGFILKAYHYQPTGTGFTLDVKPGQHYTIGMDAATAWVADSSGKKVYEVEWEACKATKGSFLKQALAPCNPVY